jgi:hypothetical protein
VSNTFLTPSVIAREALLRLQNNLVAAGLVHRGHATEFTGKKVGDTISIRKPASFVANEFSTSISVQNATESSVSLQLEKHFDVSFEVTSKELTLSIVKFSEQLIAPSMEAIAQGIDAYALSKYVQIPYWTGSAGDPPDSIADLAALGKVLDQNKVPMAGRFGIVDPTAKADLLTIEAVHRADARGDEGTALRDASMGKVLGVDLHMDQNVHSHTAGTLQAGSPLVNGVVAAGATTMNIDGGSGTETIKEGDLFTVAGASGQYVFTADKTASGGAITGATFYPAAPAGGFANDAAITIIASHKANLAGHKNAIALAVAPLVKPMGAKQAEYIVDRGMAVRVVYDYNSTTKKDVISLDILVGAKVIHPELACRVLG